jgi:phosphoglycolate phosphatase-like HAD superfamily hydrolase
VKDAWVIGDTPNDIIAGANFGAATLAVATGEYSLMQLARHLPTALLPDLDEPSRFLEIIRGHVRLNQKILHQRGPQK